VQHDIDPRSLIGRRAFDSAGCKIGTVGEVYLDDATGEPEWAAVRTGFFRREALVPLEPSEFVGGTLRVPFERALVRSTPVLGVGRHLSPRQELQLYLHYGLEVPPPAEAAAPSSPSATPPPASPTPASPPASSASSAPSSASDRDFGRIAGSES
jgi:sporulation protein YlmC with PRC-barrel domain